MSRKREGQRDTESDIPHPSRAGSICPGSDLPGSMKERMIARPSGGPYACRERGGERERERESPAPHSAN